jgi:3-phenylpropionate/trans-cinnamate dioxygenase ferredoxin reductase component
MTEKPMVIVGAGKAGARAVLGFREHDYKGEIILIGDEAFAPYDRPPLSKAAILGEQPPEPTYLLDDGMMKSLGVTFIAGNGAKAIDRAAKEVVLADGKRVPYAKLLIATGAKARTLTLPGCERAMTLRDLDHSRALHQAFTPGRSVAIAGGGFIGLELAATASKRGCQVTVIEALPRILMRGVPVSIAGTIAKRHEDAGVVIVTNARIERVTDKDVLLADGRPIPAEIFIAGVGSAPNVTLGEAAGLRLESGGIACDETMRTSDPDIHASGDCCSFPHPLVDGKRMRLEAWRAAADQAAVAAENMLGGNRIYDAVPWFWSDQYDLTLQIAGFPSGGNSDTIRRDLKDGAYLEFEYAPDGWLVSASGVGRGNLIARDVRLAEMLIGKRAKPPREALSDSAVGLKSLLAA